jgi:hypothetical protein
MAWRSGDGIDVPAKDRKRPGGGLAYVREKSFGNLTSLPRVCEAIIEKKGSRRDLLEIATKVAIYRTSGRSKIRPSAATGYPAISRAK